MKAEGAVRKAVLAYSGGLDTSVIIPWLRETYGCQVVAVIADVGQGEDLEAVRQKALQSGAAAAHVVDIKEEFIREFAFAALRAGATYEGRYLLGTALARPAIARAQVAVALEVGADAVVHGCTGKGNDQVRFELAYAALAPELKVVAPWREWHLHSRQEEIAYAAAHGIPVPVTRERPYSVDRNLWHCSSEGGILEDPGVVPPADLYQYTTDPRLAPDAPEEVDVEFEEGVPTAVNGQRLGPVALVETLNRLGGRHGVGRVDMVENRLVGMKSRGVYETPGGTILQVAHHDLESITLDRDTLHFKLGVAQRYAELVYYGLWYTPLRQALDAFIASTQRTVSGTVRVRLFKGTCAPVARWSPHSLYREDLATFEAGGDYRHADAGAFIRLFGLPASVFARTNPHLVRQVRQPAGR
ncbi:MAG: argininosuccinate synthase [Armatimonadota bacterium]|nr:argininosuccinate synthase [Armatimonadota bacterium]MDR7426792.1 argininosuccinate synthase [Armatimonadota bacterium]MDR7469882.1 argininosuccinate synthase [Armatimonadota bacterium]MDR7474342.1 argininosuccinate synthase [Armatimonadota bacterium]MDR7539890.1 argininosuccinate synthase [Armatimonadota bacterium]